MTNQSPQAPSVAYGRSAPPSRDEHGRGRKVLVSVVCAGLFSCLALALGAGRLGAEFVDVTAMRRAEYEDRVVEQTLDLIAALPYDEVADLDETTLPDNESVADPDYGVDFVVTEVERGLQIEVTLVDARSRQPLRQFAAWRGRH